MKHFSTDLLIICTFLVSVLAMGLRAGRKIKDVRAYAIANKPYESGTIAVAVLATYITGSKSMGLIEHVFEDGIVSLLPVLVCGVLGCFLFVIRFVVPRIQNFQKCLTAAELMGGIYGQRVRITIATLGVVYSLALVAKQIAWLGVLSEIVSIPAKTMILIVGGCLILYASRGGIKSVTATGMVHFVAMATAVTLMTHFMVQKVGGTKQLFSALPYRYLDVVHSSNIGGYLSSSIWYSFPAFPLSFPFIQHMLRAKSTRQLTMSYQLAMLFLVAFFLLLTLLGLSAVVIRKDMDCNVPSAGIEALIYLTKTEIYLPAPFRSLVVVGLLAMVMSAAGFFLHSASLLLVHDVMQPVFSKKKMAFPEHRVTKIVTILLGFLVLWGTYQCGSWTDIRYAEMSLQRSLSMLERSVALVFTIPLVTGLMGIKGDKVAFFRASSVTIGVFVLSYLSLPPELVMPVSVAASVLAFLGGRMKSYIGPFIKRSRSIGQVYEAYVWGLKRMISPKNIRLQLFSAFSQLVTYSHGKVTRYGSEPSLFAFWLLFNYMMPLLRYNCEPPFAYTWLLVVRSLGTLLCIGLLLKPYWRERWRSYFPAYYHLSLLYCLPFSSSILFLLEGGSIEWLMNINLSILLLTTLVDWITFVALTLLGAALGSVLYFTLLLNKSMGTPNADAVYAFCCTLAASTLIGLLFVRRKEWNFDKFAVENQFLRAAELINKERMLESFREKVRIIQTLKHAGIQDLLQVAKLMRDLRVKGPTPPFSESIPGIVESTLLPMALQLHALEHRAKDYLRLRINTLGIQDLLDRVQARLAARGVQQGIEYCIHTQRQELECDATRLVTLLLNSISALRENEGPGVHIRIIVDDTKLQYPLPSVQLGYVKRTAALRFTVTTRDQVAPPQVSYTAQMDKALLSVPESMQALFIIENERIVKAHYGHGSMRANTSHYVVPAYLGAVRPPDMDNPYMELGVAPTRADDLYPGAKAQEQEFLKAVAERTQANIETVQAVLELIKWYHGPTKGLRGEPFYLHPLAVAQIVLDYNQEEATVLAALLHDTVENTSMLLPHIEEIFGKDTASIVDKTTRLESSQDNFYKVKLSIEENVLMLLETQDNRAICVKVAECMHRMRTIEEQPAMDQLEVTRETLVFFIPQAQRLDLREASKELSERSARVLENKLFMRPYLMKEKK